MAESTESYRCVRWSRAWSDTKQFVLAKSVWGIAVAIGGGAMSIPIQHYRGMPIDMVAALISIGLAFAAIGFACVVCLLWHWWATPALIYWEDQKVIADLKDRLETHLNLDIGVPLISLVGTEKVSTLKHLGEGGLVIALVDIRFTNRSRTDGVSLSVILRVPAIGNRKRWMKEVKVNEAKDSLRGMPPDDYLSGPIDIDPQRTKEGSMLFLIQSWQLPLYEGREGLDFSSCLLEVKDYVSGKTLTKNIEQDVT